MGSRLIKFMQVALLVNPVSAAGLGRRGEMLTPREFGI
jgi:hypothetical protein